MFSSFLQETLMDQTLLQGGSEGKQYFDILQAWSPWELGDTRAWRGFSRDSGIRGGVRLLQMAYGKQVGEETYLQLSVSPCLGCAGNAWDAST